MTAATLLTPASCARSAGRRRWRSSRGWSRRSTGIAATSGGGGRSRRRIPPSAPTTPLSTNSEPSKPSNAGDAGTVNGPILITGGSGFAGSHLVQHLAGSHAVVGWARSTPPAEIASLAQWQPIDLLDGDAVTAAIHQLNPSAIFHCAGLPQVAESWRDTAAPLAANVLGTHRLLEAVRTLGSDCRILVTGSAHVYAPSPAPIDEDHALRPASPYALSKLAQEQLALVAAAEDGLQIIVTRSF